jgi:flagellar basal-body rod modification protein FlgD
MTEIGNIGGATGGLAGSVGGAGQDLGKDQFLQLLVTQLRHQDPLSPVNNEDFIAQLAEFSGLEQLQDINSGTKTGLLLQQSVTNSLAASLIGKDVLVSSDELSLRDGETARFNFHIGSEATVTAQIFDSDGELVRTLVREGEDGATLPAGEHNLVWDGRNEDGENAGEGDYRVEWSAVAPNGDDVPVGSLFRGHVDGIRFAAGTAFVLIGAMEYTLADIVEIRDRGEAGLTAG